MTFKSYSLVATRQMPQRLLRMAGLLCWSFAMLAMPLAACAQAVPDTVTSAALPTPDPAADAAPDQQLLDHYQPGSIRSLQQADQILQQVAQQRQQIEGVYLLQQNACYERFFVSSCLGQAEEQHRLALERIRKPEIDANVYKRRAKVDERDRNLEEQRVQDEQDRQQRLQQQRAREAETAEKMQRHARDAHEAAAREEQHAGAAERRVAEHQAREQQRAAQQAADAEQRRKNIDAFNKKRDDALQRQHEVARKKVEKAQRLQQPAPAAPQR